MLEETALSEETELSEATEWLPPSWTR